MWVVGDEYMGGVYGWAKWGGEEHRTVDRCLMGGGNK